MAYNIIQHDSRLQMFQRNILLPPSGYYKQIEGSDCCVLHYDITEYGRWLWCLSLVEWVETGSLGTVTSEGFHVWAQDDDNNKMLWQNEKWQERSKYLQKNLFQCHFIHHTSNTGHLWMALRPMRWKASNELPHPPQRQGSRQIQRSTKVTNLCF